MYMRIDRTKNFKKQFKKLDQRIQDKFIERVKLFIADPTDPILKNHPLKGNYAGYWSMNISGDIRALYLKQGETIIIFALIGTHSSLYG